MSLHSKTNFLVRKHRLSSASKCLKIRQHWSMGNTKLIPARERRFQREKEAIRSGREVSADWSSFIKRNASRHLYWTIFTKFSSQ